MSEITSHADGTKVYRLVVIIILAQFCHWFWENKVFYIITSITKQNIQYFSIHVLNLVVPLQPFFHLAGSCMAIKFSLLEIVNLSWCMHDLILTLHTWLHIVEQLGLTRYSVSHALNLHGILMSSYYGTIDSTFSSWLPFFASSVEQEESNDAKMGE